MSATGRVDVAFIEYNTGSSDVSRTANRRLVRAYVTRKYHERRAAEKGHNWEPRCHGGYTDGYPPVATRSIASKVECSNQNLHEPWNNIQLELEYGVHTSIPQTPTQHRFSHPMVTQQLEYLEHVSLTFSPGVEATPWKRYWLPASMNHPALFHASVFAVMEGIEIRSQKQFSALTYLEKGKAISLINLALDDPTSQVGDEIIAAILLLAKSECVHGNTLALHHHITGLMEIVKRRGGVENLGMDGLLMKMISKYSWFLSTFSYQLPPEISILYTPDTAFPPPKPELAELFLLSSDITDLEVECPQLAGVLQDLYEIIVLNHTNQVQPLGSTTTNQTPPNDQIATLKNPKIGLADAKVYDVCKACEIASLIWSEISQTPMRSVVHLRQALKAHLESTDFLADWSLAPGAHLWCLVVGIYVSRENDHTWFMSRLGWSWATVSLHRWEELQRSLAWFGWILRSRTSSDVPGT